MFSVENLQDEIKLHQEIAKNTLRKDKRINIRLSSRDLEVLKTNAVELGVTLSLHQYVSGRLVQFKSLYVRIRLISFKQFLKFARVF